MNGSIKSENNISNISISPSLSSIVYQMRRQAIKGSLIVYNIFKLSL